MAIIVYNTLAPDAFGFDARTLCAKGARADIHLDDAVGRRNDRGELPRAV